MSTTNLSELNLTISGLEDRQKQLLEKRKHIIGNIIEIKKKNMGLGNKNNERKNFKRPDFPENSEENYRFIKKRRFEGEDFNSNLVNKDLQKIKNNNKILEKTTFSRH